MERGGMLLNVPAGKLSLPWSGMAQQQQIYLKKKKMA